MHVRESAVSNDVQLNWYMITHSFKGLFFPSFKSVTTTEIKDRYKLIHSQYRDYVFNESHSLHTIQRIHREEKLCALARVWSEPTRTQQVDPNSTKDTNIKRDISLPKEASCSAIMSPSDRVQHLDEMNSLKQHLIQSGTRSIVLWEEHSD